MISVTFIQYGGMTYRVIKNLMLRLDKDKYNINFMWCKPGNDLYSGFKHPYPKEEDIFTQTKELTDGGINVIEFNVKERYIADPNLPWIKTDFWEKYNSLETDVVFTWKSGRQEYPFCHLKEPVVEWNVFGGHDISSNLVKSLAVSPFCQEEYIRNGGEKEKSTVVFLPVTVKQTNDNFRKELNIPENAIVVGMHQRAEDTIFSPISLNAIKHVQENAQKEVYIVFLGGSRLYDKYAKELGVKNGFFLSPNGEISITNTDSLASGYYVVSKFLNTLDIYTHSRKDGETLGAAIQEAMVHKLPIISHTSQWNAHIDTIGIGGKVCKTQNEYNNLLLKWVQNLDIAKDIGKQGKLFAEERYSWDGVLKQIEDIFENIDRNKDKLLLNWRPLSLDMYKKRKIYYFIRFYILNLTVMMLIKLFGQRSTRILPIIKNFFRKLFT